jgi:hypothetical protein
MGQLLFVRTNEELFQLLLGRPWPWPRPSQITTPVCLYSWGVVPIPLGKALPNSCLSVFLRSRPHSFWKGLGQLLFVCNPEESSPLILEKPCPTPVWVYSWGVVPTQSGKALANSCLSVHLRSRPHSVWKGIAQLLFECTAEESSPLLLERPWPTPVCVYSWGVVPFLLEKPDQTPVWVYSRGVVPTPSGKDLADSCLCVLLMSCPHSFWKGISQIRFVFISGESSPLHCNSPRVTLVPASSFFYLGKRKKSAGARSGEWGIVWPREYWIIRRGPGFLRSCDSAPCPPPSSPLPAASCLSFSDYLCVAGWAY